MFFRKPHKPRYLNEDAPRRPFRLSPFFLFLFSILFWELSLHGLLFQEFNSRIFFVIGFSVFFSLAAAVLTGFLPRIGNIIALWLMQAVLFLWYAAQLIYFKIFGGFISVHLIQMGGDAITTFFKETLNCVVDNLGLLLVLALPLAATGLLLGFKRLKLERRSWAWQVILTAGCIAVHLICLGCLPITGTGAYTVYDVYHNVNTGTDSSVASLGFLTTFRLECKFMLMGSVSEQPGVDDPGNLDDLLNNIPTLPRPTTPPETQPTDPGPTIPGETKPPKPVFTTKDQTLQIDFDALLSQAQAAGNSALETLHRYFAAQTPTKTNKYTGMFAGKNLIYMVCESFSPALISQELTPTLYQLYNEGIKFNNFYGTYYNVTTNGEYTACMGIFPDLSRSKKDGSFAYSANNHVPFALGNIFRDQFGVNTYGYHNYKGSYYDRNKSHPNMGYDCKFMNDGMTFSDGWWPSSDLQMMEQSIPDYINEEQFHAYYMTFSGHYAYDLEENPMCKKNAAEVAHLPYSDTVKAYISCNLELEKAMAYLMAELEKADKLEDTVIVMTSDHFPYGLTSAQFNELAGKKVDRNFDIYRNAFICWSAGMKDPIEIYTPCCTVDILPTLLNLFGFRYDSRLLVGQDVLDSSIEHIAILYNGSFITDKVRFNSSNGKVEYLVEESKVSAGYVDAVIQIVQNRFTISTAILNNDYYRIVLPPKQ